MANCKSTETITKATKRNQTSKSDNGKTTTSVKHKILFGTFKQTYGYEWDGVEPTHVDHIIPLCSESTLEGKKKLFEYHNLRLIKEEDNRQKGTSIDYCIGG